MNNITSQILHQDWDSFLQLVSQDPIDSNNNSFKIQQSASKIFSDLQRIMSQEDRNLLLLEMKAKTHRLLQFEDISSNNKILLLSRILTALVKKEAPTNVSCEHLVDAIDHQLEKVLASPIELEIMSLPTEALSLIFSQLKNPSDLAHVRRTHSLFKAIVDVAPINFKTTVQVKATLERMPSMRMLDKIKFAIEEGKESVILLDLSLGMYSPEYEGKEEDRNIKLSSSMLQLDKLKKACPYLMTINFPYNVEAQAIKDFCAAFPNLKSISIFNTDNQDDMILEVLGTCRQLKEITLYNPCGLDKPEIADQFANYSNLSKLELSYCAKHTDSFFQKVINNNPTLEDLALNNYWQLSDESLNLLAQKCLKLSSLALSYCKEISDQGIKAIAQNGSNLMEVALIGFSKISDQGIRAIADKCPKLTTIYIDECPITKEAITYLLDRHPALEWVGVPSSFSLEDFEQLKVQYPDVKNWFKKDLQQP